MELYLFQFTPSRSVISARVTKIPADQIAVQYQNLPTLSNPPIVYKMSA